MKVKKIIIGGVTTVIVVGQRAFYCENERLTTEVPLEYVVDDFMEGNGGIVHEIEAEYQLPRKWIFIGKYKKNKYFRRKSILHNGLEIACCRYHSANPCDIFTFEKANERHTSSITTDAKRFAIMDSLVESLQEIARECKKQNLSYTDLYD